MTTILITGANRGLGLEFVHQYARTGANIIACCRSVDDAHELKTLSHQFPRIEIHALDVSSFTSIRDLAREVKKPIDILLNNAGILQKESTLDDISVDAFQQTFLINTIAPLKMAAAFSAHIASSQKKLIVCISSSMGSIADNTSGGYYSYRASKAALNMVMKSAAIDLAKQQIKVLLLHPGWVRTRMGGPEANLDPKESVAGMRNIIDTYQPALGEIPFLRYNGGVVPW